MSTEKSQAGHGTKSHPSENQYWPTNSWISRYYNSVEPSGAARILPLPWPPADDPRIVADAFLVVPEGPRRKLAGGKPAQRARPPVAAPNGPCASGASKKLFGPSVAAGRSGRQRSASIPAHFFDAPLGHGATRHRFRGRRPRRTCPRLISSGVPPGREPGGHALTTGKHRRGNGVPKSFGCGSPALCSSRFCGSLCETPS